MKRVAALTQTGQQEAARLYRGGLSTQQVADKLNISIDAAFYALRKQGVQRRTAAESNRIRFEAKPLSYSIKEDLTREEESLKLAAMMLYWAEGFKVGKHTVDFANSDPKMVVVFRRFLSEICRVDESRIGCSLYCYEGQDVDSLTKFWSDLLQVPTSQFIKPYIKQQSAPGIRGPRMIHGLVHIRYCDKKLLRQILQWIDEYADKCVGIQVVKG